MSTDIPALGVHGVLPPEAYFIPPELVPNLDELVIEDGKPMDNIFAEKQQRLLTESLYSAWAGPSDGRPFMALANVGLFHTLKQPALSPDVMLSVGVRVGSDPERRENRSYFLWELGQPPDVVFEFVSDRRGGEESLKFRQYARIGVSYYVIFDPANWLGKGVLRSFGLDRDTGGYQPLSSHRFPRAELGIVLWEGDYADFHTRWLRWCDAQGRLIPTGKEGIEQERQRADQAEQRALRLAELSRKARKNQASAEELAELDRLEEQAIHQGSPPPQATS